MAGFTTKFNALCLFKAFSLSLLIGFVTIGCGGGDGGGGGGDGGTPRGTNGYTVSFLNGDFQVAYSVGNKSGSNTIAALAAEALVPDSEQIYAVGGVLVNSDTVNVDRNLDFYLGSVNSNVIEINSSAGFPSADASALSGRYALTSDIDLTGVTWTPLGTGAGTSRFTGRLNGSGYKIIGLKVNSTSDYIGLFGSIYNAHITNLGVEIDGEVKGDEYVGGIVGRVYGASSITNSYVIGNVRGTNNYVGGIAGRLEDTASIKNSYTTGNVNGTQYVGGIAGNLEDTASIKNSYFEGNVKATTDAAGGIAGRLQNTASIKNSYAAGSVNGATRTGGVLGHLNAAGTVVINTYFIGDVSGTGAYTGGLVGGSDQGSFKNSYAIGTVHGTTYVGGIAGWGSSAAATILQNNVAYSDSVTGTGATNINRAVGGSVNAGVLRNVVRSALPVGTNSGDQYSGIGMADNLFKVLETYQTLSWGFEGNDDSPWQINAAKNDGFPYLYWQDL